MRLKTKWILHIHFIHKNINIRYVYRIFTEYIKNR